METLSRGQHWTLSCHRKKEARQLLHGARESFVGTLGKIPPGPARPPAARFRLSETCASCSGPRLPGRGHRVCDLLAVSHWVMCGLTTAPGHTELSLWCASGKASGVFVNTVWRVSWRAWRHINEAAGKLCCALNFHRGDYPYHAFSDQESLKRAQG